jgi:WXG100 family type VII secretion target
MIIILRADYDQMPEMSKRFEREAANVKRSIDKLNRVIEVLKGGDWFGEGANAFYREMESEVMPAMQRLLKVLEMASGVIKGIERVLHESEQTIGGLFSVILSSFGAEVAIGEIGGLGAADGAAVGGEVGGGGRGGGAAASKPEKPASGGGGGGSGGGAGGGGSGGGGGSWSGEIGFKQEKPAPGAGGKPPAR